MIGEKRPRVVDTNPSFGSSSDGEIMNSPMGGGAPRTSPPRDTFSSMDTAPPPSANPAALQRRHGSFQNSIIGRNDQPHPDNRPRDDPLSGRRPNLEQSREEFRGRSEEPEFGRSSTWSGPNRDDSGSVGVVDGVSPANSSRPIVGQDYRDFAGSAAPPPFSDGDYRGGGGQGRSVPGRGFGMRGRGRGRGGRGRSISGPDFIPGRGRDSGRGRGRGPPPGPGGSMRIDAPSGPWQRQTSQRLSGPGMGPQGVSPRDAPRSNLQGAVGPPVSMPQSSYSQIADNADMQRMLAAARTRKPTEEPSKGNAAPDKETTPAPPPVPPKPTKSPPPEPSTEPSRSLLALKRLLDLEAQMEYAYAKHVQLLLEQQKLRAGLDILQDLPVGIDAVVDDLKTLEEREKETKGLYDDDE